MSSREIDFNKVIYYDSEYCFKGTTNQTQWKWAPATLRVQTMKVGSKPIKCVDVWKEPNLWDEIFDLLEQGYTLVAHNCMTPDHEVLTEAGWRRFDELKGDEKVMQWDPQTEKASLVHYMPFSKDYEGKMYEWNTKRHQGIYTPDHRMYYRDTKEWKVDTVQNIISKGIHSKTIPSAAKSFEPEDILDFSEREIQLIEAIRADGSYNKGLVRFHLKKSRKIQRLLDILSDLNISYSIYHYKTDNTISISLHTSEKLHKLRNFLGDNKSYNSNVLKLSTENQNILLDEVGFWDGSITNTCTQIYSSKKEDLDWISILAHLNNRQLNVKVETIGRGFSTGNPNFKLYKGYLTQYYNTKLIYNPEEVDYKGKVYCISVPSKAFFVRRNEVIWITGNCIADIRPDLCPDRILKYILNGQVHDTLYLERLTHGMTDPIGESSSDIDDDEEEDSPLRTNKSQPFALDRVIYRHTGVIIKKTYQNANNWLKRDLSDKALEYAANDVRYMETIYKNQISKVNALGLWEVVDLNHQLLATSYLTMKYGIPIDTKRLREHRTEVTNKANELAQKLLLILPKVTHSDSQLIDKYFDIFWQKGKGLCGLTNKSKAAQIVKKRENHAITNACWRWVEDNRDKLVHEVNLNSSQQKLEAFQKLGYKIEDTAEATIREYTSENECPVLESYLDWQKCNSLLKKILEKIDYSMYLRKDNTIKSTFTWVRALNGRSSAKDMNCFSGDTEVLTPNGWVSFKNLNSNDLIAQYTPDTKSIEFIKPLNYIQKEDTLLHISNTQIDLKVTPDHRCLLRSNFRGKEVTRDILAKDYPLTGYQHIHSGIYSGKGLAETDDFIRLLVTTQADGSYRAQSIEYSFTKERKIKRLRDILDNIKAAYTETVDSQNRTRFYLTDINLVYKIRELMPNKIFKSWILDLNQEQLQLFCKESLLWDGCDLSSRDKSRKSIGEYCSTIKENSEWVQIAWSLIGHRALLKEVDRRGIDVKGSLSYRVYITNTDYSHIDNRVMTDIGVSKTYCVSVPSSYIMIRSNGKVSISGQCQQVPRELKDLYGAPEGMVKVEYDYSAIELMKMLNDYPVDELVRLILDDKEDIHIYNASKFFNRDYKKLLEQYRAGDKEAKLLRNAAKTVIYFLQYKSPVRPEDRFVTGVMMLIKIFNSDLGWDLKKEEAEHLILTGENIILPWTSEKLLIDGDIARLAAEDGGLQSELLSHLKFNTKDIELAMEEGIIYFTGAKGMYYEFDLLRDGIYTPEKSVYDENTGEWKVKKEYINSRSLYSCRLAGPIAIAAKSAVERIQNELFNRFGPDKARLGLFVHDSITCYCKPEIAAKVEEILCKYMLKEMYKVAGFSVLPVYIEGGVNEVERKVGYDGKEFSGIEGTTYVYEDTTEYLDPVIGDNGLETV